MPSRRAAAARGSAQGAAAAAAAKCGATGCADRGACRVDPRAPQRPAIQTARPRWPASVPSHG